ncbi:MAG: GTP-sensing pleiotropic transcriptional regulator CodY [Aminobacterium sp.]|jgi:transcriptional pleiotropic repressor|uniref:GTP-sensing pleiotropic transcriptional regulator CodY n=1 Tax=Aminobacterium sp. MB27-C1 TaxID=3070661 RepID=UPI0027DC4E71|nr:GTP-sensing pleiotropic transcriptional regulator CodY [Aminobacterium sp. MB27-C1]MDD2207058.1 GTP-sensing pleiotropic transcriptional regulator CodY [Aminobacterium sp.]MDD3425586.1 GTP-sensing pleiotropic transcriptional regulator CodY [Aminobacterium sp.]MDD4228761.1 GTP-sensing pleiotropic transcriptional regulator CodY [Aminobacterium sp.]MDD4550620.1 GTP-sensing pleiotropic transcriptional regulator CodY [Aminobacterium sp.]WMI71902.1 GTP-sensing pleiotropic transcriptional regulator
MTKGEKKITDSNPVIVEDPAMKDLLDKTRQVGRALQNRREGTKPDYNKLAKLLCEFSTANVYIINREGKILGYSWISEYHSEAVANFLERGYMPENFVEKMNQHRESILSETDGYLFDDEENVEGSPEKHMLYVPIYSAAERLGTLLLVRFFDPFYMKDLILAEYLATLVGIEILHDRTRSIEERARERLVVQMAMRALSYSEVESVKHIIAELGAYEGVVIASKVADRVGVTRSVIVNALRKLESAGIIESRSLGMKGTFIKILSPLFIEELGMVLPQSM